MLLFEMTRTIGWLWTSILTFNGWKKKNVCSSLPFLCVFSHHVWLVFPSLIVFTCCLWPCVFVVCVSLCPVPPGLVFSQSQRLHCHVSQYSLMVFSPSGFLLATFETEQRKRVFAKWTDDEVRLLRDYLLKLESRGTTSRRLKTLPQSIIIIIFFHDTKHRNKAPRVRGCKTYPQHDALNPTCNCEDWVVGVEGLSLSSASISNIHVPKHQTKAQSSRTHLYLSNVHGQTSVLLWCTALWPWSPPWWRVLTTVFPATPTPEEARSVTIILAAVQVFLLTSLTICP